MRRLNPFRASDEADWRALRERRSLGKPLPVINVENARNLTDEEREEFLRWCAARKAIQSKKVSARTRPQNLIQSHFDYFFDGAQHHRRLAVKTKNRAFLTEARARLTKAHPFNVVFVP